MALYLSREMATRLNVDTLTEIPVHMKERKRLFSSFKQSCYFQIILLTFYMHGEKNI